MSSQALAEAFEACTLDASAFDHEHHLKLAWHYLTRHPLPEAMILLRDGLKRLTAHLGVADKYHETITFAILMLVHERMAETACEDFATFKAANGDLFTHWRALLEARYSKTLLDSSRAREAFVLPDRMLDGVRQ